MNDKTSRLISELADRNQAIIGKLDDFAEGLEQLAKTEGLEKAILTGDDLIKICLAHLAVNGPSLETGPGYDIISSRKVDFYGITGKGYKAWVIYRRLDENRKNVYYLRVD
jgi:hypothetical protein